jgi:hypothetical protein
MKEKTVQLIVIISLITGISLNSSSASAATANPKQSGITKPPCRVDMQLAHESNFFRKIHQTIAVKANVVVICDKALSNIVVKISLYKKAHPFAVFLATRTNEPIPYLAPNTPRKISGPVFVCTNWKKTAFFIVVGSTAILNGKVVTAPVRKSFSKIVECGS